MADGKDELRNNKEVFSLFFLPPLLEEKKKTKIHKHLLYRQEALIGFNRGGEKSLLSAQVSMFR